MISTSWSPQSAFGVVSSSSPAMSIIDLGVNSIIFSDGGSESSFNSYNPKSLVSFSKDRSVAFCGLTIGLLSTIS